MTRRCFPYEIWRVFYNLARPVANSLVDGWKQFSSAQVQNGWVPHVYLGTRLLVLLFLLKESWYTRWKPLKIEYFFFLLEKKRQDSYWDFCLRGCVCFATWRQRIQSHMDLTVLSLSPHLTSCLLEKLLSSFGISARGLAAGFLLLFCVFYLRLLKSYTHGRVFFDFQPTNRAFQPKFFYFAPVRYAWKLVYHWPETLNVIWRNKFVFRFCDFFNYKGVCSWS